MDSNAAHLSSRPGTVTAVCSAAIQDLPAEVLFLIFWCYLRGQDIARCTRVCRYFADLIHSDVYLQYGIELAKNGMVDGPSSTLPVSERLQRLRQYSSSFRNGIFDREDITAHPEYAHQLRGFKWNSRGVAEGVTSVLYSDSDTFKNFLSILMDGSVQAGIPSRRFIVETPADHARSICSWDIDRVQDLSVTLEYVYRDTNIRVHEVHFRSWSAPQTDHPAAIVPCIKVPAQLGTSHDIRERIDMYPPIMGECHVLWKLVEPVGALRHHSIHACDWRTGQIISRIDLGAKDHTFQLLDDTYVLVLPRRFDSDCTPHLTVYSISPSSGSSPTQSICSLQLPAVTLAPGERILYRDVRVSRPPPTSEGHFQADPSVSMVVITDYIEVGGHPSHPDHTCHLLIPYATLHTQIQTALDSNSNRHGCVHPVPVLWEDWGPHASLRLCAPVVGDRSDAMTGHQILVPYGSRMPVSSFDGPGSTCASVYVFDINPLAARYVQQALRAAAQSESGVRATAIVEDSDVEAALPGVVDPDIKGIPFVVYRFKLPPEDPGWPAVRAVRMSMTGFTVTYGGHRPDVNDISWTI